MPQLHSGFRLVPVLSLLIAIGVSIPIAGAQTKKYGYNSRVGGGNGAKFSAAESTKISDALDKIKTMSFTTKEGTYSGAVAESSLRKMLKDGRMGKGVGANRGVNGVTRMDGKNTAEGDVMNIADHHVTAADNKDLANTLVHEWLHTTQAGGTEAEDEAPAHQLGRQVYLDKGGGAGDAIAKADQTIADNYKKLLAAAKTVVPGTKVPDTGASRKRSYCGGSFVLDESTGTIELWSNVAGLVDNVVAGPNRLFFDFLVYPGLLTCDRLIVFGADLTIPASPQGIMTVLDADPTGFVARTDQPLAGVYVPFSITQDPVSEDVYVLDAFPLGQGILRMQNFGTDHVPDNILPFAPRGFPGVDSAETVIWADIPGIGAGLAVDPQDGRGDGTRSIEETLTHIRDSNLDGTADIAVEILELQLTAVAPHFVSPPVANDLQVEVQAMPGHLLQVVLTDPDGNANFGTLGNGVGDSNGAPQLIPLFGPLPGLQYVKVVDVTDNTQAAFPSLIEELPPAAPSARPATVALVTLLLASVGVIAIRRRRVAPR